MSRGEDTESELRTVVDDCLDLLDSNQTRAVPDVPAGPLPSLIEQARNLLEASRTRGRRPLCTIHHLACSGGTLFAKAIAAMPNTCVLSEIDPLARRGFDKRKPRFAPTDLLGHLRYLRQDLPDEVSIRAYTTALRSVYDDLTASGLRLVIRDHSHSHYCVGEAIPDRPAHSALLAETMNTRSVVTVRDPLESWLSLSRNGWVHFQPGNFDEYCRRYAVFLDDHDNLPIFQYEEFVADPEATMRALCQALELDFVPGFEALLSALPMTGDSGRGGRRIRPLEPKRWPEGFSEEVEASKHYSWLKARMGY
ncbi:sulfotransferase [Maricaulaceae bacterium EIL42A08]|nr:sulfotransferase [Maricaulaceae bacterium EIL42A08]